MNLCGRRFGWRKGGPAFICGPIRSYPTFCCCYGHTSEGGASCPGYKSAGYEGYPRTQRVKEECLDL